MLAAIDIGSNAMRMSVGAVDGAKGLQILQTLRAPVRLGRDVFAGGTISEETTDRAVEAFRTFKAALDKHNVQRYRAVATSALREATNRDLFTERIAEASGISIDVIGGEEEARLVMLAVASRVKLEGKTVLLIDIGGGSVEVTLAADGHILITDSFRLGAVRLLEQFEQKRWGPAANELIRGYVDAARERLKREIGSRKIDFCVATGGNCETIGVLRKHLFGGDATRVTAAELETILKRLQGMTAADRVREFALRPDRADVIVPAGIVLQTLLKRTGVDQVVTSDVGVQDGLLLELAQGVGEESRRLRHQQLWDSALQMGRKFQFDESHGGTVAALAAQLFDATQSLHGLTDAHRIILEVAALLHDVGYFIGASKHHKHSHYLIISTPLLGLTDEHLHLAANVARYHRKAPPSVGHETYRALSPKDRVAVSKLAALLRLADALDTSHTGNVKSVRVRYRKPNLHLLPAGTGDLLLERWGVLKKAGLFEQVFGAKVVVDEL